MMPQFKELNKNNINEYLNDILQNEILFPESIRADELQITSVVEAPTTLSRICLVDGKYAGNVLALSPSEEFIKEFGLQGTVYDPSSVYVYSFAIVENLQRSGIGKKFLEDLLNYARKVGYLQIEAHCRDNASYHMAKSAGAHLISECPNWCDTGETYYHCKMRL